MSITDLQMLFKFIGGLGMFLYGMNAWRMDCRNLRDTGCSSCWEH